MAVWRKRSAESSETGSAQLSSVQPSKDAPLSSLRYAVFDTELTSLDHRTNRLLSIGAVAMQGTSIQIGEQFYRVVNPEVSIPAASVVIHKLRSQDCERGEPLATTLEEFCRWIAGSVIIGHFVEIDLKILRKEMAQTGHKLDNPSLDTARIHDWLLRHGRYSEDLAVQLEKLDLSTVAHFYHVEVQDAHHALSDAFLTARIWQRMQHVLQQKGVDTLGKAQKIGGA